MRFYSNFLFSLFILFLFCFRVNQVYAVDSYTDNQVWSKILSDSDSLIIDVRTREMYIEEHIPTAINMPLAEVDENTLLNLLTSYGVSEYISYCSCVEGSSAHQFATIASEQGIQNIYFMIDDFKHWPYQTITGENPGSFSLTGNSESNSGISTNMQLFFFFDFILLVIIILGLIKKRR